MKTGLLNAVTHLKGSYYYVEEPINSNQPWSHELVLPLKQEDEFFLVAKCCCCQTFTLQCH